MTHAGYANSNTYASRTGQGGLLLDAFDDMDRCGLRPAVSAHSHAPAGNKGQENDHQRMGPGDSAHVLARTREEKESAHGMKNSVGIGSSHQRRRVQL